VSITTEGPTPKKSVNIDPTDSGEGGHFGPGIKRKKSSGCPTGQLWHAPSQTCYLPCSGGHTYNAATGGCDCPPGTLHDPLTGYCVKPVSVFTRLKARVKVNDPDYPNGYRDVPVGEEITFAVKAPQGPDLLVIEVRMALETVFALDGFEGKSGAEWAPAGKSMPVKYFTFSNPHVSAFLVTQVGDTTSRLAERHGVGADALVDANPELPRVLFAGRSVFARLVEGQLLRRP